MTPNPTITDLTSAAPINKTKAPTKRDVSIFNDMAAGKVINSMQMYEAYNTTSHRDIGIVKRDG